MSVTDHVVLFNRFFLCMMYVLCHFEDYERVLLATLTELTVLRNERASVGLSKDKTPVKFPYTYTTLYTL